MFKYFTIWTTAIQVHQLIGERNVGKEQKWVCIGKLHAA